MYWRTDGGIAVCDLSNIVPCEYFSKVGSRLPLAKEAYSWKLRGGVRLKQKEAPAPVKKQAVDIRGTQGRVRLLLFLEAHPGLFH